MGKGKQLYRFLGLLMLCILMGAGARAEESGAEVMAGSEVFIHPSGMIFFADGDTFGSALMGEDGTPYELVTEGSMPYEITHIVFDGNYFYLNTSGGIYRAQIGGMEEAQKISDKDPNSGFYLYGDHIYYQYADSLYRVGTEGGESEKLTDGVEDYELTEAGIYYSLEDGGLCFILHDGTGQKKLCETQPESRITAGGNYIYFWAEGSNVLGYYSVVNDQAGKLELSKNLSRYYFLATPEYFFYMDDAYEGVRRYDLISGEETELEQVASVPFEDRCMFHNGFLYQFDQAAKALVYSDPARDIVYRVEMGGEDGPEPDMDYAETEYLPSGDEFMMEDGEFFIDEGEAAAGGSGYEASGDFDIAAGITVSASEGNALLTTDHFQIYLPLDGNWTWEAPSKDVLRIYHQPSAEAGCGGSLVSIRAFDWGDDTYADFPSWQMAGVSNDKKYVAIFPTDVQADPQNPESMEEYSRLLEYVRRINADSADNPFIVLDY